MRIYWYEIKRYEYHTNEYSYKKWQECLNIRHTVPERDSETNEYPNIFVSTKRYKQMSEYICIKKINFERVSE